MGGMTPSTTTTGVTVRIIRVGTRERGEAKGLPLSQAHWPTWVSTVEGRWTYMDHIFQRLDFPRICLRGAQAAGSRT